MDAIDCIKNRMSIRGFTKDPVPKNILQEIIDTAKWSPSYKNTQPWEIIILSGEKKKALSEMMINLLENGAPVSPDLPEPGAWPPAQEARIAHLFKKRAKETGIDLSDPGIIKKAKKANFSFYNAPHAIYLFQDDSLPSWSLFDLGLFAQSLMLAAHAKGLGTVPQAFTTDYAKEAKEFLGIPATKRLVLGLSIGYPNPEAPVNAMRTDRVDTDELVLWIDE